MSVYKSRVVRMAKEIDVEEFLLMYHDNSRGIVEIANYHGLSMGGFYKLLKLLKVKTRREVGIRAKNLDERSTPLAGRRGCGSCDLSVDCQEGLRQGYRGKLPCEIYDDFVMDHYFEEGRINDKTT